MQSHQHLTKTWLLFRASSQVVHCSGSSCLMSWRCVSQVCPILSLLITTSWRLLVRHIGHGLTESLISLSFVCKEAQQCCYCCSFLEFMTHPLVIIFTLQNNIHYTMLLHLWSLYNSCKNALIVITRYYWLLNANDFSI